MCVGDPEVRKIMADIQREMQEWADQTPEENAAQFRAGMVEWCERQNALPLEDRLRVFAAMQDVEFEEVEGSVSDVSFRWRDPDPDDPDDGGGVTMDVRLIRPAEQVYVTVTISEGEATFPEAEGE